MENNNLTPSFSITETPQKRSGGIFVKVAAVSIILGVAGAGASLASRVWDPVWNPFRPEPESVLAKMAQQTKEIKTLHSKTTFEIDIKNENEFKINGDFEGDNDATNPDKPKTSAKFNLNVAAEGMQFSLAGEAKALDETSYFKFTTIPAMPMLEPFFAIMGIDLQKLKNQWIKFDKESFQEAFTDLLPPDVRGKIEEERKKQTERQKELMKKIEELVVNKNFFIVKAELPDEKINGVKNYHYLVALNNEEVKKLIPEILKIGGKSDESPFDPFDIEETFKEKFDEFLSKVGEIKADVWIGKKDLYLYKLRLEKEIDASQFDAKEKGMVKIKFLTEMSNFNKPVEISEPPEFKTFKEIFTPRTDFLGLNSARAKARDARRKADISQVWRALEMYNVDNGKYPQSAIFPENALQKYLAGISDPGNGPCPGSYRWINNIGQPDKFCIYTCLENGKYFSTASEGSTRELSFPPTNLNCGAK